MPCKIFFAAAAGVMLMSSPALAHPGSKILTTGSADARAAMTSGMTYEDVKGVHIFRGRQSLAGGASAPTMMGAHRNVEIEIAVHKRPWRRLRHLRTQGFYSGNRYPSRRYTQGFYSGH